MTVGAGLGPRKSLALAVRAADLAPWSDRLQEGQARLRGGRSWQKVLEDWPYLGGDWLAILSVGEESGQVDALLAEVAAFYESEVEYDVKQLSDRIEPIMIVIMAGFVTVLALGIFLPMWDMYSIQK